MRFGEDGEEDSGEVRVSAGEDEKRESEREAERIMFTLASASAGCQ